MARAQIDGPYGGEPLPFTPQDENYTSLISRSLNWYAYEKDKKDARNYLKHYIITKEGKDAGRKFDSVPDSEITTTFGFLSRMVEKGVVLSDQHSKRLHDYIQTILSAKRQTEVVEVKEKVKRPSVIENMIEKVNEYLGELEGTIDDIITADKDFDLFKDLQAREIPGAYCTYIGQWIKYKAADYILVYESTDTEVKEGYSNLGKRKLTQLIKTMSQWSEDCARYEQFKKANRKPRVKKVKSPTQQVAKLKYLKEFAELGLKSINVTEIVGASQVWVYNTKYKRVSVYRSDSRDGIQVKGTTLQNYDPDLCEQKTLRKPKETIDKILKASKVPLRKLLSELSTKDTQVNGRINEECIILRAIK